MNFRYRNDPRAWCVSLLLCAGLLFIGLLPGCKSLEFTSRWRTAPVDIDGHNTEWQNALVRLDDKQVMVGFMNDGSYLYMSIVTDDRGIQRQIMFRGLTVWFDREGGEEKRFGVHFPVGMQFGGGGFRGMAEDREGAQPDSTARFRMPPVDTSDVEIIGPVNGEHHQISKAQLREVAVSMDNSSGTLVYELKVPLTDNGPEPYAIGTQPGKTIGIGLETAARQAPQGSDESGGGGGGRGFRGGGMGGRGGRRGGGGGDRGGRSGQQTEPLSVWAKIELATGEVHP